MLRSTTRAALQLVTRFAAAFVDACGSAAPALALHRGIEMPASYDRWANVSQPKSDLTPTT